MPGFVVGIPAGIWDIDTFAELSNIGTLFAFIVVSAGVIVLRKTNPERPRSFRTPWVPLVPLLSIGCCLTLMAGLPLLTWIRFFVWLAIGLVIYFLFGRRAMQRYWRVAGVKRGTRASAVYARSFGTLYGAMISIGFPAGSRT